MFSYCVIWDLLHEKSFYVNVNSPLRTGTSGNFNPNLKLLGDYVAYVLYKA
jgi:hypothetical protein